MISSGRSFTWLSLCYRVSRVTSSRRRRFEPAAHAGVDAQRAGLEDDAADQVGVDAAGRLDGAAGGLLDLRDDRAASSSDSSNAVVSSTVEPALLARRRAPRTRARSRGISAARPFSATSRTKLRTSSSAPPSTSPSTSAFAAGRPAGSRGRRELGHRRRARARTRRARSRTASSAPCSCAASKSARAYMRCATATLAPSAARARRSRGPRSPRRSGGAGRRVSSTLPDPLGRRER